MIDVEEIVGSSLPIDQRLALWTISDVLMATPIREGLNLLPMEYIFTKKKPATPGVVISSEFSAVSSILNGALRVNPFDIQVRKSFFFTYQHNKCILFAYKIKYYLMKLILI